MEGGRKRQEAGATSGRRRAKAEQDPGAAERRRVRAEQDGAAERARAWEATLERRRVKAEQEAAAGSARAPVGGRRRQAREDPLARATTARDALEAREAREAAADYSRMGAEREAVEERERVRAGRQRAIAEKKAKEEEARRKEEEIRQKEEEARIALQKLERETRELTRRLRQLEVMEKEAKEKLDKEKQEAGSGGGGGGGGGEFGPRRWPTREEFQDAMQKTQYDRNKFHIAIVGGTGSGKSSLINAFRNLRNKDPGAARAGMAGTTLEIGRYPEAGTASAGQCIVWYDFPGAGTQRDIPDHDLFVRQGLFVFDLVLLAIGDRFAEIDARIVEDCARFQIPVFIVWSKADMHILNLMKEYGDYVRAADNPALYAKCRDEFISQTQRVVSAGLAGCREKLPGHEVYVVSRDVLQRTYNGGGGGGGGDLHRVGAQHDAAVIHEGRLSRQLLAAAAGRRCDAGSGGGGGGRRGEEGDGEGLGTQALNAADGSRGGPAAKRPVTNAGNRARNTAPRGDAAGGLAAGNRNSHGVHARTDIPGPSNPFTAAGVLHSNRQRNPPPPPPPVQPLQPPPLRPPRAQNRTANERKPKPAQQAAAPQKVLKMIYPRQPTDSDELFADLIRSNPDIEHMLVCKPRMFNPKAGMLTFSHLAPVPDEVTAFGATLRLKDYEARSRRGAGEKKGEAAAAAAEENDRRSNLPTCGDGGPELESGWDS